MKTTVNGKELDLTVNIGAAMRVLEKTGANIFNPASETGSGALADRLMTDDLFLIEVAAAITAPQFETPDAAESFFYALGGAEIAEISKAFWESYERFFTLRGKAWAAKAIEIDLKRKTDAETQAVENLETFAKNSDSETSPDSQDAPDSAPSTT